MTIWFASGNGNKKKELAAILGGTAILNLELRIPADAGLEFDPEETGTTFYDNALLKARALYALLEQRSLFKPGDMIIADDSGICVDALDGRPGIYSARYTGPPPQDSHAEAQGCRGAKKESHERNALLLEEIGDNPLRAARFVCAMALFITPNRFYVAQETLEGEMVKDLEAARGTGGFGYDPVLYIPSHGRTVAELSEEEKNTISHRAKAGKIIAAIIEACG